MSELDDVLRRLAKVEQQLDNARADIVRKASYDLVSGMITTTGTVAINSATSITGGLGNVWGSGQAYSVDHWRQDCHVRFRPVDTAHHIMVGLNSDPATDANYATIDYAWYPDASGNVYIYESSIPIGLIGTYAAYDTFEITYDGAYVRYYQNGALKRSVARAIGATLYFDSSFYSTGTQIDELSFGPIPATKQLGYARMIGANSSAVSKYRAGWAIVPVGGTAAIANCTAVTAGFSEGVKVLDNGLYFVTGYCAISVGQFALAIATNAPASNVDAAPYLQTAHEWYYSVSASGICTGNFTIPLALHANDVVNLAIYTGGVEAYVAESNSRSLTVTRVG